MEAPVKLRTIKVECMKLISLIDDYQPGLMSWQMALAARRDRLAFLLNFGVAEVLKEEE